MVRFLQIIIRLYQKTVSPDHGIFRGYLRAKGVQCRFHPSCSQYFSESVGCHGALKGAWAGTKRIARCHPWGGSGYDPVTPERK